MPTGPAHLCDMLRASDIADALCAHRPVWLWDIDGGRILFANAAGVGFFREATLAALCARRFKLEQSPVAPLARAAAMLPRDGTPRLALLRFFVGARDVTLPCQCQLLDDREWPGRVVVKAMAGAVDERALSERLAVVFDGLDCPIAVRQAGAEIYRNAPARGAGADKATVIELDRSGGSAPVAPSHGEAGPEAKIAEPADAAAPETTEPVKSPEAQPRRFSFVLDAEGRFVEVGPALADAVGGDAAALVGRYWADVANRLGLDPQGEVAAALRRREAWGGIVVGWPTDGGAVAKLQLSAQPRFADGRVFAGYRGFGDVIAVLHDGAETSDQMEGGPGREADRPKGAGLNDQERTAFKAIGEALGAGLPVAEPQGAAVAAAPNRPPDHAASGKAADENPPADAARVIAAALDRLPVGLAILRDQLFLYANPAFLETFDYSDIDDMEISGGLAALFEGRRAADDPAAQVARRRDGTTIVVESRMGRIQWIDGPALFVTAREVSAAPSASEEPAAQVAELRAILDTATDGVIVLSGDGRVETVNRSAEALFGRDAGEVEDRRFDELVAPESRAAVRDYLAGLASGGVGSLLNDGREIVARASGGDIPLFLTIGRIGDGEAPRYCAVMRDLTQWKAAEAELVTARKHAESASARKSDFLARMSHEIRTPLNAIIGFAEVMVDERFGPIGNERYREYVKDMRASGEHIMSLVNDLLDLAKVEAGRLELNFAELNLNDIVEQSVAIMQPQANCEQVIIRTSLARGLPPVLADARSMRQVLLNVLSNAIKFTPPGGQAFVSTARSADGEVTLRVRDTGIGMSDSDVKTALEPFRQLAVDAHSRQRGTGLGLPLTRALVEANRAGFEIRSRLNEGTLVEICFPPTRVIAE